MAEAITIRPMVDSDLSSVLDTLRAALGETPLLKRTPELWDWKHVLNPFGRSIVLVAADRDRVVAVRPLMRWRLRTAAGIEISCVRAVDTAVHPEYHRQGLFRRLNDVALEAAREAGVALVFNTPNPMSRAGYLKQGWRDVGRIGVMVRPTWRLLTQRAADGLLDPGVVLPGVDPAVDLAGNDRPPRGLRTDRSGGYRTWRFAQHPTASYRCIEAAGATAVVRVNRRNSRDELVISELIGPAGHRPIAAMAKRATSGYLVAWFSPGSPERRAARRAGLVAIPRITALTMVARPLVDLDVDVFSLDNWDLALSDLELL